MIRNIEILGQAVKGISDDTRALEPEIPWRKIAGMRDKLIHEYFGVELGWYGMSSRMNCRFFVRSLSV